MSARELLQKVTGLNLTETEAQRAVDQRMRTLALDDGDAYLKLLAARKPELQALTELVVVPESWMFRDADAFHYVCAHVQRRLKASPGRPLRIASIPCAGGEEPYSMAMALHDAGVPSAAYSIDGFDLSDVSIARARRGRYTRNAFRGARVDFRERYFTAVEGEYEISESIKRQVSFSQGNLLAPEFANRPRYYDVIFCRNLLIYFDEPTTASAIGALATLLADDGVMLAGYAEVPSFCRHGFAALREPGAFALVKKGSVNVPPERRTLLAQATLAHAVERRAAPASAPALQRALAAIPQARPQALRPLPSQQTAHRPSAAAPANPAPPNKAAPAADKLARARSLADLGDYQSAQKLCREVLATSPDSADAYFILGMLSECQQQSAQAGEHWRRCVYLQPDHYDALCHLALLAGEDGDQKLAAAFKQRAARIFQRMHDSAATKGVRR